MRIIVDYYVKLIKGYDCNTFNISILSLFQSFSLSVIAFLALYAHHLDVQLKLIGFLLSVYGVGGIIGSLVIGYLNDIFNNKVLMISILALQAIMTLILSIDTAYYWLLLCTCLIGISNGGFRSCSSSILRDISHAKERANTYGLTRVMATVGQVTGAAVAGLISVHHYNLVCYLNGIILAVAIIVIASKLKLPEAKKSEQTAHTGMQTGCSARQYFSIILTLILIFSVTLVYFQINITYPLYLAEHYHISNKEYGFLFLIDGVLIVLFELPILSYLKQFSLLNVISLGVMLLCFGFGALPLGQTKLWVIFTFIILSLGMILSFSNIWAYFSNVITNRHQGLFFGLYQAAVGCSAILAPILGSFIYHYTSPKVFWYSISFFGAAIFLLIHLIKIAYRN